MKSFADLDISKVKSYLILLDIDGTLTSDASNEIDSKVKLKINELKKRNKVYLCSNSNDHQRNKTVAQKTDTTYLETDIRKPSRRILQLIAGAHEKNLLVIGDKCFTDGRFAKKINAKFIKVKRIRSKNESLLTIFYYLLDDLISKFLCH